MEQKIYKQISEGDYRELGASRKNGGMNFAVTARMGGPVSLLLYKKGEKEPCEEIPFPEEAVIGSIYALRLEGFKPGGYEYNFKIRGEIVQDCEKDHGQACFWRAFGYERSPSGQVRVCDSSL